MQTTPAIYVGTYGKYNNGSIAGKWITLTQFDSREEFYEACYELHKDEADPELMFQDYEGIPTRFVSESGINWDFIDGFKAAQDRGNESAFYAYTEWSFDADFERFETLYRGEAEDEESYAEEYIESIGILHDVPPLVSQYFDMESYAHDLFLNELAFVDGFVFRNC